MRRLAMSAWSKPTACHSTTKVAESTWWPTYLQLPRVAYDAMSNATIEDAMSRATVSDLVKIGDMIEWEFDSADVIFCRRRDWF